MTTMEAIDSMLVQLRDEDPSKFNTGEHIERGVIYPSYAKYLESIAKDLPRATTSTREFEWESTK